MSARTIYRMYCMEAKEHVWVDGEGNPVAQGHPVPEGYIVNGDGHSAVPGDAKVQARSPGMTLPKDSAARKEIPLFSGCFAYFPAALAEVAKLSKVGNDKHNPEEPLHHARGKSMDHEDCILRHTVDAADLRAVLERGQSDLLAEAGDDAVREAIIYEKAQRAWRDLADLQQTIEELRGVPMAPAARCVEVKEGVK